MSSVSDILALETAISDGDLLSDTARQRWNEPLVDPAEGGEGYGFVIAEPVPGVRVRASAGAVPETHHDSMWVHELDGDLTLVASSADGQVLAEQIVLPIYQLLDGEDVPAPPRVREVDPGELDRVSGTYRSDPGATVDVVQQPDGVRLTTEDGQAFADLFPAPEENPEIAPLDQVVGFVESFEEPEYRSWLDERTAELGPLQQVEPVGVAPVDASEPAAFVRLRFERGAVLTAWEFSPEGEAMSIDLGPQLPGVMFRPVVGGGFASFSVTQTAFADRVSFADNGVMTIHVDGRTVEYRRDG